VPPKIDATNFTLFAFVTESIAICSCAVATENKMKEARISNK
jgi:hypothetical protein